MVGNGDGFYPRRARRGCGKIADRLAGAGRPGEARARFERARIVQVIDPQPEPQTDIVFGQDVAGPRRDLGAATGAIRIAAQPGVAQRRGIDPVGVRNIAERRRGPVARPRKRFARNGRPAGGIARKRCGRRRPARRRPRALAGLRPRFDRVFRAVAQARNRDRRRRGVGPCHRLRHGRSPGVTVLVAGDGQTAIVRRRMQSQGNLVVGNADDFYLGRARGDLVLGRGIADAEGCEGVRRHPSGAPYFLRFPAGGPGIADCHGRVRRHPPRQREAESAVTRLVNPDNRHRLAVHLDRECARRRNGAGLQVMVEGQVQPVPEHLQRGRRRRRADRIVGAGRPGKAGARFERTRVVQKIEPQPEPQADIVLGQGIARARRNLGVATGAVRIASKPGVAQRCGIDPVAVCDIAERRRGPVARARNRFARNGRLAGGVPSGRHNFRGERRRSPERKRKEQQRRQSRQPQPNSPQPLPVGIVSP